MVLGCCPDGPRCLLCPPPTPRDPAWVEALVASTAGEDDAPVEVRFFGGAPPSDAQLRAAAPHPCRVRVRPDLLPRAEAERLRRAGVTHVELDALSFHGPALRAVGRRYRAAFLAEQAAGLRAMGLSVGGVLAPGLPEQDHDDAVEDARIAATQWSFARLHPVLVLDGSALRELHARRRYTALSLAEALTVCHAQLDVLEAAGVDVVRVGLQPGPDGFGRAVAGPAHPGFRELVEARRTLDRLRAMLVGTPRGAVVTVTCAPADQTRTRGALHANVRTLRAELGLAALQVAEDPALARGTWRIHVHEETA